MYSTAEVRVVRELIKGLSNIEIGKKLCISEKTVKFHITRINKKSKTKSRSDFISSYYRAVLKNKDLMVFSYMEPLSPILEHLFKSIESENRDLPTGQANAS